MEMLQIINNENEIVFKIPEVLDLRNGSEIKEEIMHTINHSKCKRYVFDLDELDLIDSFGIGVLIRIQKSMNDFGEKMYLLKPNASIVRTFELLKLTGFFKIIEKTEPDKG